VVGYAPTRNRHQNPDRLTSDLATESAGLPECGRRERNLILDGRWRPLKQALRCGILVLGRRSRRTGADRAWTLFGQLFPTFVATLLSAELVSAASVETKAQLCASCHGEHGLPSDPTVPIIWGQQAAYIQTELNAYRNGDRESQIMSSIAESLSDAEISQIAAYFGHAKWPVRSDAPPSAPAPDAIATCQACHNANLAGGMAPTGVAPRLAGQLSPYLRDTMNAYANGERANSAAMSTLMQSLSPEDRKAVADYLASMP
jgi:cytochrome c553